MMLLREEGAYHHISYWLGSHLCHLLPAMVERSAVLHTAPRPFHQHALSLLQEGFQWFGLNPAELEIVTAKKLYQEYTSDIPEAKVTNRFLQVNFLATCGHASPTHPCRRGRGK